MTVGVQLFWSSQELEQDRTPGLDTDTEYSKASWGLAVLRFQRF